MARPESNDAASVGEVDGAIGVSSHQPQGPWQPRRPDAFSPSAHPSATIALFLGLGSLLLGPFTGVPAMLLARGVARDIEQTPRSFWGGLPMAAAGGVLGWLGSAVWLAFVVRSALITSRLSASLAIVVGALLVAAGVAGMVLRQLQRFASRTGIAFIGFVAFALLAPGLQFFGRRGVASDRCDAVLREADALARAPAFTHAPAPEEARQGVDRLEQKFVEAEQACEKADRSDHLVVLRNGRAELAKLRAAAERDAADAKRKAREDEHARAAAAAVEAAEGNASAGLARAAQSAAKGRWEELADAFGPVRKDVGRCQGTSHEAEANKIGAALDVLEQRYKPQLVRVRAARAKAEADREALATREANARPDTPAESVFAQHHCEHLPAMQKMLGVCAGGFLVACDSQPDDLPALGCSQTRPGLCCSTKP